MKVKKRKHDGVHVMNKHSNLKEAAMIAYIYHKQAEKQRLFQQSFDLSMQVDNKFFKFHTLNC